jgi:RHS repeat-associated protein
MLLLLPPVVLLISTLTAQVAPGVPNFSTFDSHEVDTVNLLNNNISIDVPIRTKAGSIPFTLHATGNYFMLNTNAVWQAGSTLLNSELTPSVGFISNGALYTNTPVSGVNCPGSGTTTEYIHWAILGPEGTYHNLPSTDFADKTSTGTSCILGSGFTDVTIDNSGLTATVTATGTLNSIFNRAGTDLWSNAITDRSSNQIFFSAPYYTDSLGMPAVTQTGTYPGYTYTWPDYNTVPRQVVTSTSNLTLKTVFACSGIGDLNNSFATVMPSGLAFPDGTSLGINYETTPGFSPKITGRLGKLTLRQKGTITYSYSGGTNGIDCAYQNVPKLTRTLGNGDVTTYTLVHSVISGSNYKAVNTVVDPAGNQTVYTFTGFGGLGNQPPPVAQVITDAKRYSGTSTLLAEDVYCYNTPFSSCSFSGSVTATVSLPITSVVVMHKLGTMATTSAAETDYDNYGNVIHSKQYGFGSTTADKWKDIYYGTWNGSSCSAITNANIHDKVCVINSFQEGSTVAQEFHSYDANGNLLTSSIWTGTSLIGQTSPNTYNSNGSPLKTFDLANNETDYSYYSGNYSYCGGCTHYPFPTLITKSGLEEQLYWNGTGAVPIIKTDVNSINTTYCYNNNTTGNCNVAGSTADPYWRVLTTVDDWDGAYVTYTYPTGSTPTVSQVSFPFNSGNSINQTTQTTDGYGRPILSQTNQSPSGATYDTVSAGYSWSSGSRVVAGSEPCSTISGGSCTNNHTSYYDPLSRLTKATTTGNETVINSYNNQDVVGELDPAPTGENAKKTQTEVDGLGRVYKVCKIQASGGSACNQATGTLSGITDTYAYGQGNGFTTIGVTRGSQTRTTTFDALGRVTQMATPEGGTSKYFWDSGPDGCGFPVSGTLSETKDNAGLITCYYYDNLERLQSIEGGRGTTSKLCRVFAYDSLSYPTASTPPSGYNIATANPLGRMIEASTGDCTDSQRTTDEWFSYDGDGHLTDVWQSTPHSGGYYHSTATYFANGQLSSLSIPGLGTVSYTVDGEGRLYSATLGTVTLGSGVTYGPLGPTTINVGSGTDKDTYVYSAATGRMTNFQFNVGTKNAAGTLNWNPNGTLGSLGMVDGFNSINTQTCAYVYDDVTRLVSDQCGTPWAQTYQYDQYDNLNQFDSDPFTFTYDPATNHYNVTGVTYDASGDLTYDGTNTYTYNAMNKLASVAPYGYTCTNDSNAACFTYDAFGRVAEKQSSSGYSQTLYSPAGKSAGMSGQTLSYAFVPLPGGTFCLCHPTGSNYYAHSDWLGTVRVASTIPASGSGTIFYDRSFAPYGQLYGDNGPSGSGSQFFTGDTHLAIGLFDTPNRELNQSQGRWLTPDPAHSGWNLYAYPTNPNSSIDPSGLGDCHVEDCGGPTSSFCGGWCDGGFDILGGGNFSDFWNGGCSPGMNALNCSDLGPYGLGKPSAPSGFHFGFGINGPGVCDSDFMPCGDLPTTPAQAIQSLWANAFGLPTLPCATSLGPWCNGQDLVNPIMDANPADNPPSVSQPPNPILQYYKCASKARTQATNDYNKVKLIQNVTMGNAIGLCGLTGPDAPLCALIVGSVGGTNSLIILGGYEMTVYDAETKCLQQ